MTRSISLVLAALFVLAPTVAPAALTITGKRITDVTVEFSVARQEDFGYVDFTLGSAFQGANPQAVNDATASCYMTTAQAGGCSITSGGHFFKFRVDIGPTRYCDQTTLMEVGPLFGGGGGGVESGSTTLPTCSGAKPPPPPPTQLDKKSKKLFEVQAAYEVGLAMLACAPTGGVQITRGGVLEQALGQAVYDRLEQHFQAGCEEAIERANRMLDAAFDPPAADYQTVAALTLPGAIAAVDCSPIQDDLARTECVKDDGAFRAWRAAGALATNVAEFMRTTYDRLGGAQQAADDAALHLQSAALQAGAALLATVLERQHAAGVGLAAALKDDGIIVKLAKKDFAARRDAWAAGNFPPEIATVVAQTIGVDGLRALAAAVKASGVSSKKLFAGAPRPKALRKFAASISVDALRRLFDGVRDRLDTGIAATLDGALNEAAAASKKKLRKAALASFVAAAQQDASGEAALLVAGALAVR
jgi:hypothetical protein